MLIILKFHSTFDRAYYFVLLLFLNIFAFVLLYTQAKRPRPDMAMIN